jgi:hypothetical protein
LSQTRRKKAVQPANSERRVNKKNWLFFGSAEAGQTSAIFYPPWEKAAKKTCPGLPEQVKKGEGRLDCSKRPS